MELQEALDKIKDLETQNTSLENEKSALIRKRDELLNEVKGLKAKYGKFADRTDLDTLDLDELLSIKQKYEQGDSEAQNRYKSAYEADKKKFDDRLKAIEDERKAEKEQRDQDQRETAAARLKADAIAEFSKEGYGIRNPEQFFRLFGDKIQRDESGKLFVGDEYKQQNLKEYIEAIGEDENSSHHFKPKGGSGVGASVSTSSGGKTTANPFKKESFNLTEQGRLLKTNPELARRLAAEAGAKLK